MGNVTPLPYLYHVDLTISLRIRTWLVGFVDVQAPFTWNILQENQHRPNGVESTVAAQKWMIHH
jgi:hypothetical protein